jgi:hypothetical protein
MEATIHVAWQYTANVPGATVEKHHRLFTMPAEEEGMNRSSFGIADDRPEPDSPNALDDATANERKGVVALWMEGGETLLGRNTDVSFQHGLSILRIGFFRQGTHTAEARLKTERIAACS